MRKIVTYAAVVEVHDLLRYPETKSRSSPALVLARVELHDLLEQLGLVLLQTIKLRDVPTQVEPC